MVERIIYSHADAGVLPAAESYPWVATGTWVTQEIVADELHLVETAGLSEFSRGFAREDGTSPPIRVGDRLEVQVELRVASSGAELWSGTGAPTYLAIDDGNKGLVLAIGPALKLMTRAGVDIKTIKASHSHTQAHVYHLIKEGSAAWVVIVDGVVVSRIPYDQGGAAVSSGATVLFGVNGTADTYWRWRETGLNQSLPKQWRVDRVRRNLPPPIQARWNARWRAMVRAVVGLFEDGLTAMEGAWSALTAQRMATSEFVASGEVLFSAASPAWTLTRSAAQSVVRQRVRMDSAGGGAVNAVADFGVAAGTDEETVLRATVTVRSHTLDSVSTVDGRVGPVLHIGDGAKRMAAELVDLNHTSSGAQEGYGWQLTKGAGATRVVAGQDPWPVGVNAPHTVELQLLGQDWLLLIVDGLIVDRVQYSDLASTTGTAVTVGLVRDAAGNGECVADFEDVYAARRWSDQQQRPLFLQTAVERLIFVGGCERNDELETWMRRHHQVEQMRGTTRGLVVELWRITCSQDAAAVANRRPASWYLERSYPEVSPVFLEAAGDFYTVFAEFPRGAPNFTPQQLADLMVRYLLPYSVTELTYHACLATLTTGAVATAGGEDKYPVKDSADFTVGDTVTLRNSGNTVTLTTVISSIPDSTHIHIAATAPTFASGSTIRKILATS